MSFTEKIDVLELLVSLLKEHEDKLDTIIEKMEIIDQTINQDPRLRKSLKEYDSSNKVEHSILIVDDDKNLANSFKLILESVGYKVETAYSGLQALYKINKAEYDLVLLDLNLPDMMGQEIAEEIKEEHGDTDIVFITGYSSLSKKNGTETLIKPINPDHLLKTTKKKIKSRTLRL